MQKIGRYQIVNELGRGAMGVVYRAQDPAIGRTIAIKTIRLNDLSDTTERERLRERLFREAQSAGILSHPNIVTIYDILEEEGMAYIFMEFVNGPSLEATLASDHALDGVKLLGILRQTASALDYAHRKGIVHRDIKPANVMIHEDGAAKITDFGVAKIVSQQMTQAGAMMGTPNYMSPEQIEGVMVDGKADQFSLGVIVYESLTGEKPFVADYVPALLYKICRDDPGPPQRLNPTLNAQVETVLRRALAKEPAERYPTCVEFVRELEQACLTSPDWQPMPRGASQSLPTLGSTSGPRIVPVAPAAVLPPPPAAVQSPPTQPAGPRPSAPVAAVRERPAEVESNTVRNVFLALTAIVLIALIAMLAQRSLSSSPAPSKQAQSQPAPIEQKPAATQPEPAPIDKPSPTAIAETIKPQAAPPPRAAENTTGEHSIDFVTSPPAAKVVVDGNNLFSCTTPCSMTLPNGRHTFSAVLEGHRSGQKIFETPRDTAVHAELEHLQGTLSVNSNPAGAVVYLNGQAQAQHTPAVLNLPVGSYRLQVVKDNLKYEETVQIRDGSFSSRSYTLE